MITCEAMTDRIVPVAHGQGVWNPEEQAHLASCGACAAEWRLVRTARQLGGAATGRLDPHAVGQVVLARLHAERRASRWRRAAWIGALAAAAAIAILVYRPRGPTPEVAGSLATVPAEFRLPVSGLDSLDAAELTAVLDQLDAPLGEAASPEAPGLGDLQDTELERVLRSLEG